MDSAAADTSTQYIRLGPAGVGETRTYCPGGRPARVRSWSRAALTSTAAGAVAKPVTGWAPELLGIGLSRAPARAGSRPVPQPATSPAITPSHLPLPLSISSRHPLHFRPAPWVSARPPAGDSLEQKSTRWCSTLAPSRSRSLLPQPKCGGDLHDILPDGLAGFDRLGRVTRAGGVLGLLELLRGVVVSTRSGRDCTTYRHARIDRIEHRPRLVRCEHRCLGFLPGVHRAAAYSLSPFGPIPLRFFSGTPARGCWYRPTPCESRCRSAEPARLSCRGMPSR